MGCTDKAALFAFFLMGVRRAKAERGALVARLLFFALLMGVYWSIWKATPLHEATGLGLTASQLLWYLMITETITLSPGAPLRQMEADIQSGDIAGSLARPVPYGLAALAEWSGTTMWRVAVMFPAGIGFAALLTGGLAISPLALLLVVPGLLLGCAMMLLSYLQLGYVAAWWGASTPAFWIWQKFLFLAGGLILPLTLYPAPLRQIAAATPFAAILYAPASLLFDPSPGRAAAVFAQQLIWLGLLAVFAVGTERAATRRFVMQGV